MKKMAAALWVMFGCQNATLQSDAASTSASVVASSAPSASALAVASAPTASASASVIAITSAVVSASASSTPSTPPAWLNVGAGESVKERIATGSNTGCYIVKVKRGVGEEIRCQPMDAPGATVDDVDLTKGRECPPGFGASGADSCTRTCKSNAQCHGKHKCDPDAHQCM